MRKLLFHLIPDLCLCGCNEITWTGNKYIQGHNPNKNKNVNKILSQSYQKWLNEGCPKIYCQCNCGNEIIIQKHHKWRGIPKYIHGHNHQDKHQTEETKIKISNTLMNHSVSIETRQKIRLKNSLIFGRNHSNYGKLPSPKTSHGKGCYYESPLQGNVWLRSSYELVYAKYLDKNSISWLYEIETFGLGNTTYTPDFFLPTCNLFIEIKGYMSKSCEEKIDKFLDYYNEETLQILRKNDLIKLGCKL